MMSNIKSTMPSRKTTINIKIPPAKNMAATAPEIFKTNRRKKKTCNRKSFRLKYFWIYFCAVDSTGDVEPTDFFILCVEHFDDIFQGVDVANVAGENYIAHAGKFTFRARLPNRNSRCHLTEHESFFDA